MYGFIFINSTNIADLLSINGIIQLVLVFLSLLFTFIINKVTHNKLRIIHKPLHHILHKCFLAIKFLLLFAISTLVSGLFYSIYMGNPSILSYSIGVFLFALIFCNLIYYGIAFALGPNHKRHLLSTVKVILAVLLILWTTNLDTFVADSLSSVILTFGKTKVSVWSLVRQASYVMVVIAGMMWLSSVIERWVRNALDLDANIKQLLSRFSKVMIIASGIYIILPSLGIDLTALSVFGGALGVGLGFGLQKIASNFLSGFIILIDKSVKIGDRVIINDITGIVTKITTRYTVMQAFDGAEVIIPNERLITDTIINQTHSNTEISLDLLVSVGYSSDLNQVLLLINESIKKVEYIRADKAPLVYIKSLGASGIDIFVRVWPIDPLNESIITRNKLTITIIEAFRANRIEIPFPKLDVNLVKSSDS